MLSFARHPLSAAVPASNLLGTDLFQCPVRHAFLLFSCFLFSSVCLKSPHQDAVGVVACLSLVSELPPSRRLICFGVNIKYAIRSSRKGFKAGALKKGMECDYAKQCEYIAIFDADFQPEPDFLLRTVPFLMTTRMLPLSKLGGPSVRISFPVSYGASRE
ncbi:hypothetical protein ABZP36_008622 [Zizania latifolia]